MNSEEKTERLSIHRRIVELESTFPLKSPEQTLGHRAISLTNHHYAIAFEMSQYDEETNEYQRYSALGESLSASVEAELGTIRGQIADIKKEHEDYFERYMNAVAPFYVVHAVKELEELTKTQISWKKWLTEYASEDELLFFLRVHNHVIEQQQTDRTVQGLIRRHQAQFTEIVNRYHERGSLAKSVSNADAIELKVGDIFNMVMEERTGFYEPGIDEMYIQQGYQLGETGRIGELLGNINYAVTHELVHATLGESLKHYDQPLAARWFNEAMTENIAVTIDQNTTRKDRPQSYESERRLLHRLFAQTPDVSLAYKLAMRAYSGSNKDRQEFLAYLDMSIGVSGALERMNDVINLEEHLIAGVHGTVTRSVEEAAIERIDKRLRLMPTSLFIRYEDTMALLPRLAAQE